MNSVENILSQLGQIADNPKKAVKDYIDKTGNKAIGCFPEYCPEEIVYAANMLPVGLWGGQVEIDRAKSYLPAFACSLIQACLEFGIRGEYDVLSGVIVPSLCDTLKCIGQDWKVSVPHIPFIQIVYPHNRKILPGVKLLESEYVKVRRELEKIGGRKISDKDISNSIDVYNKHRKVMRNFVQVADRHLDKITPLKRHEVVKSGYFMDKAEHTKLIESLIIELEKLDDFKCKGSKVVLTGIMSEPDELLKIMEENQIYVVGDNLAQESIQFDTDVPEGLEPINRLAKAWSNIEGFSLAYDPGKKRGDILTDLVKKNGADGVIVSMIKFCDPEEFDYPVYKEQLDEKEIPVLYIEIDQQDMNSEQARTRIQAFKEMLES
ncbi:2-hydroxyacyl-CoA dehydratase subunit D [Clostridium sp. LBM24168]